MALDKVLGEVWNDVQEEFFYPQIPTPKLTKKTPNGEMNFENLEILINPDFIKDEAPKADLTDEELLDVVLAHEVTHFVKYPGSILNILRMVRAGKDLVPVEKASMLRSHFSEVQTNLYGLTNREKSDNVRNAMLNFPESHPLELATKCLYQNISGYDLGATLPPTLNPMLDELSQIDYTTLNRMTESYVDFVKVVTKYEKELHSDSNNPQQGQQGEQSQDPNNSDSNNPGNQDQGNTDGKPGGEGSESPGPGEPGGEAIPSNGEGSGKPSPGDADGNPDGNPGGPPADSGIPGPGGDDPADANSDPSDKSGANAPKEFDNKDDPPGQGGRSLDEIQKELDKVSPGKIDLTEDHEKIFSPNEILRDIGEFAKECDNEEEFKEVVNAVMKNITSQTSAGFERKLGLISRDIYSALASNYGVQINEKHLDDGSGLFPHSQSQFSVGDPLQSLNPFSSRGIYPGLSRKWDYKGQKVFRGNSGVPLLYLLIDNSGSMPNPDKVISTPVLAGTVIADSYLANGSLVAVYSFGGHDRFVDLTHDKDEVHKGIRYYTDGGTTFNQARFLEKLSESDEEFDVAIISDMDLNNPSSLVKTIEEMPASHRVHLLYNKNNSKVASLKRTVGEQENVVFRPLMTPNCIRDITMGDLYE